jgi:hypothetical protein
MVRDYKPGVGSSPLTSSTPGANALGPGKQTKVEAAQPSSLSPMAAAASPPIASPQSGIDKPGFVDNSAGAPLYNKPAEVGGVLVRDAPLPPAARVFVSGTAAHRPRWLYVTSYIDGTRFGNSRNGASQ